MAKITKIFLDLDDVLNTFTMPALAEVGCPVGVFDYSKFDPAWGMDIVRAANMLHGSRIFSKLEFWNSLGEEFWRSVPLSKECWKIISSCVQLVGKENVCILTAFHLDFEQPYVASAKARWIRDFLPSWMHDSFLIGPEKVPCASPDALLIDDSDSNVKKFREAKGHAILVPRPWNVLHGEPVMDHVHAQMGGISSW